jgi:uncharacterized membrane protein YphA (DoxX/SURF4 family)
MIAYWVTTALAVVELIWGGVWDILRVPQVRVLVEHLGYPTYFLVILGIWKLLGAVALVIPKFPRLKEWAYAGVIFDLTGAVASLFASGLVTVDTTAYPVFMIGVAFLRLGRSVRHLAVSHNRVTLCPVRPALQTKSAKP